MFNLLLTDDEVLTLESIGTVLEGMKERLQVDRIFTAESRNEAVEIFLRERVDILVCDVEMPQSSGFELADWVRSQGYRTEIIFLTCHADFSYAKRALALESLDYLLKPVDWAELSMTILKAVTRLQSDLSLREKSEKIQTITGPEDMRLERFWENVVRGDIAGSDGEIAEAARRSGVMLEEDTTAVLILQSFHGYWDHWTEGDYPIIEYARRNLALDLLLEGLESGAVLRQWEHMLMIVCCPAGERDVPRLRENCRRFIDICSNHLSMGAACYTSDVCRLSQVAQEAALLRRAERKNVYRSNKVFSRDELESLGGQIRMPEIEPWRQMLSCGLYNEVMEDIVSYFQQPVVAGKIDDDFLREFRRSMDRMFYTHFFELGLTKDPDSELHMRQFERAVHSIPEMLIWISGALQVMRGKRAEAGTDNVINRVKNYIHENLESDLTREQIAGYVYLNADYLSRVFKRSEGISLMEYLIRERIEVAKRLLRESTIPISDIALSVGYSNFSHFSKIFKKKVGMNPGEYRKSADGHGAGAGIPTE